MEAAQKVWAPRENFGWMRCAGWAVATGIFALSVLLAPAGGARGGQPAGPATGAPSEQGYGRPVATPASVRAGDAIPTYGFQFGLAPPYFSVDSAAPAVSLAPGPAFSDGAVANLELVLGAFRIAYSREMYRADLAPLVAAGEVPAGSAINFDADQFWLFYGFRPWRPLYVGYGVGAQRRRARVTDGTSLTETVETPALAGLLVDYFFWPPFSLRLLVRREGDTGLLQVGGAVLAISYIAPLAGE